MGKDYLVRNIPTNLHVLAKSQAALEEISLRELIIRAIAQYLGMEYPQEKKGG
jgi:predicted HicB family RNase H-like nuclease